MAKIKEIFKSIQGEGPYIGREQLFIRFCCCNLNCDYCDTNFDNNEVLGDFSPEELLQYLSDMNFDNVHSISLTGGEPLLSSVFLKAFLPLLGDKKIYLETNATLSDNLLDVIQYVDIIAADIKLKSATGIDGTFELHDKFFEIAKNKELFAKIVFNQNITNEEIVKSCELAKKYNIPVILQPQMCGDNLAVSSKFIESTFLKFLDLYHDVRLIPQVHKFINVI